MELKWLEDFVALVQAQSFSRAAEARNITQSGLRRRIRSLEQWVRRRRLVDRSGYPPALTAAGRLFHEVTEDVLQRLLTHERSSAQSSVCPARTTQDRGRTHDLTELSAGLAQNHEPALRGVAGPHYTDQCARLRAHAGERQLRVDVRVPASGSRPASGSARYESLTVGHDLLMPVCTPKSAGVPRYKYPGPRGSRFPTSPTQRAPISAAVSRCCSRERPNSPSSCRVSSRIWRMC